jgi:hypothetical protein
MSVSLFPSMRGSDSFFEFGIGPAVWQSLPVVKSAGIKDQR